MLPDPALLLQIVQQVLDLVIESDAREHTQSLHAYQRVEQVEYEFGGYEHVSADGRHLLRNQQLQPYGFSLDRLKQRVPLPLNLVLFPFLHEEAATATVPHNVHQHKHPDRC